MATLDQIAAEYSVLHGEAEYRYFKKWIIWSKERRKPGYHTSPINEGDEVTKAEYEEHIAESKHLDTEAFMGRLPRSYWRYHKKLSKDGWREHLVKDVQNLALPAGQP